MKIDDEAKAAIERWYDNWVPEGPPGDLSKALFKALKKANQTPQERNAEKFDTPWGLDMSGYIVTNKGLTIGHSEATRPLAIAAPEMAELLAALCVSLEIPNQDDLFSAVVALARRTRTLLDRIGWER